MAKAKISMGSMTELFNNASAAEKSESFKVEMIDIDLIVPNQNNDYSIESIDELALDISFVGVRQNLEVSPLSDGKYNLISGERRYTAVKKLVEEQKREDLRKVPCKVTQPSVTINLDIPEEIKELWLLTTTNSQMRDKTDGDILIDIRNQRKIYKALLDAGVTMNGKQRDIIAEALKMSPTQVHRYTYIDKNLSPELRVGFEENKIPLTVAYEAAKQDEEQQEELTKKFTDTGTVTQADVEEVAEKPIKKKEKQQPEFATYIVNKKDFQYCSELNEVLAKIKEGVVISGKDYDKLQAIKAKITKQQETIYDILSTAIEKSK